MTFHIFDFLVTLQSLVTKKFFLKNNQKMYLFWVSILINFGQFLRKIHYFYFFWMIRPQKVPKMLYFGHISLFLMKMDPNSGENRKNHDFDSEKCSESSKNFFLKKKKKFDFFGSKKISKNFFDPKKIEKKKFSKKNCFHKNFFSSKKFKI